MRNRTDWIPLSIRHYFLFQDIQSYICNKAKNNVALYYHVHVNVFRGYLFIVFGQEAERAGGRVGVEPESEDGSEPLTSCRA